MAETTPAAPAAAAAPPPPPPAAAPAAPAPAAAAPVAAPVKPAEPVAPPPPAAKPAAEPAADPAAAKPPAPPDKPAADGTKPEPAKPAVPAPADFELKLPDGAKYDPEGLGTFKKIMADEKLTPAQRAHAVLDLDQKIAKSAQAKYAADLNRRAQEMRTKDIETLKADPKYGGAKYEATVQASRAAAQISEHGPAVSKLLEASGLDNHPDIVRFLADVRSKISEDTTPAPGSPTAKVPAPIGKTQTERGAAMYGQLREKKAQQAKK